MCLLTRDSCASGPIVGMVSPLCCDNKGCSWQWIKCLMLLGYSLTIALASTQAFSVLLCMERIVRLAISPILGMIY